MKQAAASAVKTGVRRFTRPFGVDVVSYPRHDPDYRAVLLMKRLDTDLVFDVGANTGQYAHHLRRLGYPGRIVSFEPLHDAFLKLRRSAENDADWSALNFALGAENAESSIHVSGNSTSSSLRPMLPAHVEAAPGSQTIGDERIEVRRLDDVFDGLVLDAQSVYLKVDTQGFEDAVLDGATGRLSRIQALQLEMTLAPLYDGQVLFPELLARVQGEGFRLVDIAPGFTDRTTGQLLQVDGIFARDR